MDVECDVTSEEQYAADKDEEEYDNTDEEYDEAENEEDNEAGRKEQNEDAIEVVRKESVYEVSNYHHLNVGDKFDTFEQLQESVKNYQDNEYALFYRRDAMSIDRCRKKGIKRPIDTALKYYNIQYYCVHGGKKYQSKSTGARKAFTFQSNCPAVFHVSVDETGHKLIIKSIVHEHNHQRSSNLFRHYPRNRRLTEKEKRKIAELLDLEANRVKVKNLMQNETKKVILLKDLDNCKTKKGKQNLLIPTLLKLEKKFNAEWYLYEDHDMFAGLFFVTESMKLVMDSYPEYLGIDGTFKLLNIRAPVYLMIVEDPNGCSEVAGVCILVSEDRDSINWMLDIFKKAHKKWDQIKCVMTDKDINERDAIKEAFPSANVIICAFHTLRIFGREITTEKRNITREQRDAAKVILEKLVYAATEEEYNILYEDLKEMPKSIIDYFNEYWHPIRNEWSLNNTFMHNNFLNTTNNRLESLNSKVKKACNYYNSLEEFVEKLVTFFCCLNSERDHKAATIYHKRELITFDKNPPLERYHKFLTPYAFQFIQAEYNLKNSVNILNNDQQKSQEIFISYEGLSRIKTAVNSCDCTKFSAMNLPCRHIFAVRESLKVNLFDEDLCLERWTRHYYFRTQRVFQETDIESTVPESVITSREYKKTALSQHQKFKNASLLIKDLAGLISEKSNDLYLQRMQNLSDLLNAYRNNEEVIIVKSKNPHNYRFRDDTRPNVQIIDDNDSEKNNKIRRGIKRIRLKLPSSSSLSSSSLSPPLQSLPSPGPSTSFSTPSDTDNVGKNFKVLEKIIIQPAMKQRGRPRGIQQTAIGLPFRKKPIKKFN